MTEVWLVMENAPDAGSPDSAWSTQEAAELRAAALSGAGPYQWSAVRFEVDPDV